ncbi:MAG TPA: hypothetical protein VF048_06640 [Gemmatimonadaceae bacterium]|jgi:hypothetical protein
MRRYIPPAALGLVLALAGCQDLAVTNPNRPDRGRSTQQPASVEAIVASAFRAWWPAAHDDYPAWAFATIANEVTSGFADFGQLELSAMPRSAWNNSPVNNRADVNEDPWYEMYGAISSVNDALIALDSGLVIGDAAQTARARAVAKFIQGISHGSIGLFFDQGFIVGEGVAVDTITTPTFHPYPEVLDTAIAELDASIAIASGTDFTVPASSWLFQEMSSAQLAQLANSFAARLLAYEGRTRAERDATDWAEVIRRVDAGIQTDFAPVAQPDILWDDWKRLLARVRTASRPSDFGRPSYWLLGPADSTDGFVSWASTPVADRQGFQMVTKDRRIQGDADPATPGLYFGYNRNDIFRVDRGTYRYSWYYFHRFGTGESWQEGAQPALTVTEMHLLKAEALIRLNRAAEAVPLINESRVANGQLPPVTIDGPPDEPGCVPRKLNGQCGSLWDALRYEKGIEGIGVDATTAFLDARGWQTLPENSILQLPVPGRELETLQVDNYTFGGPGGQSSAPAPDPERCPVALPRCP